MALFFAPLPPTLAHAYAFALPRPFCPIPSGPLHFGSLVCALASYLDAKQQGGQWHLRIEDIDPPREVPGAAERIVRSLEQHGLGWDGPVLWQSQRSTQYEAVLEDLRRAGHIYPAAAPANVWNP